MGILQDDLRGCGLPRALESVGDRWSLLIVRAAFAGVCHFEDFLEVLGIARNILSSRLTRLVEDGILVRTPNADDRRKIEYVLTDKGSDLLPALMALRDWSERHCLGRPSTPRLIDKRDGKPVLPVTLRAHDDRKVTWQQLEWKFPSGAVDDGKGDCDEA